MSETNINGQRIIANLGKDMDTMRNGIRKRLRKSLGFLLLLVMLGAMTVHAEEGEKASGAPDDNGKAKEGNVTMEGNVSGDLENNAAGQETETGTDAEKKLPTVTESRITWDGGELRIPVDLGDYSGRDDIFASRMRIISEADGYVFNSRFNATLEGNMVIVPFHDLVEVSDREQILTKAGDYTARVGFYTEEGESSEAEFTLHVPIDSKVWKVLPLKAKFDGSQDVTFSFENGTNYYELAAINSLRFAISKNLEIPDELKDFSVDMNTGKLVIKKEAIAEVIRAAKKIYDEVG